MRGEKRRGYRERTHTSFTSGAPWQRTCSTAMDAWRRPKATSSAEATGALRFFASTDEDRCGGGGDVIRRETQREEKSVPRSSGSAGEGKEKRDTGEKVKRRDKC